MKNKLHNTTTKLTRRLTLLILTLLFTVGTASAATYAVNSTNDSGDGIYNPFTSTLMLNNTIVSDNTADEKARTF